MVTATDDAGAVVDADTVDVDFSATGLARLAPQAARIITATPNALNIARGRVIRQMLSRQDPTVRTQGSSFVQISVPCRDGFPFRGHHVRMAKPSVAGNARLTGAFGAAIFVLLFVEGLTIVLRVDNQMSAHVFVGVLVIPFVVVKIGSTGYRFFRYYTGRAEYVEKGPPPIILRWLGPVVTITTVAVLATGIAAVFDRGSDWLGVAHKASFVIWFGAMALHVLGHLRETPRLALADWRRRERVKAPGASARLALLAAALGVGIPLAIASLGWAQHWQHAGGR